MNGPLLVLAGVALLPGLYAAIKLIQILRAVDASRRHWSAGAERGRYEEGDLALFEPVARRARKNSRRR